MVCNLGDKSMPAGNNINSVKAIRACYDNLVSEKENSDVQGWN